MNQPKQSRMEDFDFPLSVVASWAAVDLDRLASGREIELGRIQLLSQHLEHVTRFDTETENNLIDVASAQLFMGFLPHAASGDIITELSELAKQFIDELKAVITRDAGVAYATVRDHCIALSRAATAFEDYPSQAAYPSSYEYN